MTVRNEILMAQRGGQQHLAGAGGTQGHCRHQLRRVGKTGLRLGNHPARVADRVHQHQLFLGAGEGDVPEAQILRHLVQLAGTQHATVRQGQMLLTLVIVGEFETNTHFMVEQQFGTAVLFLSLATQASQEHHRKLQALGGVDGHQAHAILTQGVATLQILVLFLQTIHIPHKGGQSAETALLKTTGDAIQLMQVRHSLATAATGGKHSLHIRLAVDRLQQAVGRQRNRQHTQTAQTCQQQAATGGQVGVLPLGGHLLHRHVQRQIAAIGHADGGQIVGGKAEQRRQHHSGELHLPQGVVNHTQEGQGGTHLGTGEKTAALIRGGRDAHGR